MKAPKQSKKIIELLSLLNSTSEKDALNAVKRLKVHGNTTVLEPLLNKFIETKSDELKNEILIFFSELKASKAPPIILSLLKEDKYQDARALFLNTCWNSGLDYSNQINDLCQFAVDGDFMIAFECFTILDNFNEVEFDEEDVTDGTILIREYFAQNMEDSDKNAILQDMLTITTGIGSSL